MYPLIYDQKNNAVKKIISSRTKNLVYFLISDITICFLNSIRFKVKIAMTHIIVFSNVNLEIFSNPNKKITYVVIAIEIVFEKIYPLSFNLLNNTKVRGAQDNPISNIVIFHLKI
jgi:hypothetical protein